MAEKRKSFWERTKSMIGVSIIVANIGYRGLAKVLDEIGRGQVLMDLAPAIFRVLSHPAAQSIIFFGGIALIIWAHLDQKAGKVQRENRKMTLALYVSVGAILGALIGLGAFVYRHPVATPNAGTTVDSGAAKATEAPVPPILSSPNQSVPKPIADKPKRKQTPEAQPVQVKQEGRSNIAQIGNNNVATIYEAPPIPRLELKWDSYDIPATEDFKYRKEVKITPNIDYSPVSLAIVCDSAPQKIELSFKQFATILTNLVEGIDVAQKAAFFHFETAVMRPTRPLYVTLSANEPFRVVEVRFAKIPGFSD